MRSNRKLAYFDNIIRSTSRVGSLIAMTGIAVMMMVIVVNIFSRFFGESIVGTYELVQLTSVVVVSFAVFCTAAERMHVKVEIVLARLPQRPKLICYGIARFISLGTCAVIAWAISKYAWEYWLAGEQTPTLGVFLPPFRFLWAFGCALLCAAFLKHIFEGPRQ